jgi:dnd system-associated protein 4
MPEARRVRPPRRTSSASERRTLDRLVDDGPFQSKQKAMMFAAALGAFINRREPLQAAEEPIRWEIFQKNGDEAFIHALAINETGSLDILASKSEEDDYVLIFEEHANAGLAYLEDNVLDKPVDVLDAILDILVQARRRQQGTPAGLEGITADQLDVLGL